MSTHCNNGKTALETCQNIKKMVFIGSYQFEPESDDETVEVADRQETDLRARLVFLSVKCQVLNKCVVIMRCDSKLFTT